MTSLAGAEKEPDFRLTGVGAACAVAGVHGVIDRKCIGMEPEARLVDIEWGQLRLFATATAELNPIFFFDKDSAKKCWR